MTADETYNDILGAIEREAVNRARHDLERAMATFPDDERFRRLARLIAPPRVVEIRPARPIVGLRESQAWLKENASHYRGQWIAVLAGELLAAADTLKELDAAIPAEHRGSPDILVERVSGSR